MDERVQKALKFANYRTTLNNQLELLKFKVESSHIYSINGGSFQVNRELLVYTNMLVMKEIEQAVLLDKNGLPVLIDDISQFHEDIFDLYHEILNDYHNEYESIRNSRSVQSILDLDEID